MDKRGFLLAAGRPLERQSARAAGAVLQALVREGAHAGLRARADQKRP